jgi:hypothetical protein
LSLKLLDLPQYFLSQVHDGLNKIVLVLVGEGTEQLLGCFRLHEGPGCFWLQTGQPQQLFEQVFGWNEEPVAVDQTYQGGLVRKHPALHSLGVQTRNLQQFLGLALCLLKNVRHQSTILQMQGVGERTPFLTLALKGLLILSKGSALHLVDLNRSQIRFVVHLEQAGVYVDRPL